jgi:hypothetical protein
VPYLTGLHAAEVRVQSLVTMTFVVGEVALGQIFSECHLFSLPNEHPSRVHICVTPPPPPGGPSPG